MIDITLSISNCSTLSDFVSHFQRKWDALTYSMKLMTTKIGIGIMATTMATTMAAMTGTGSL